MKKISAGILFGGKSSEHQVSLLSAINVINAIDKSLFDTVLIGIDQDGQWLLYDSDTFVLNQDDPVHIRLAPSSKKIALIPGSMTSPFVCTETLKPLPHIDVIFSVLHGAAGENGSVQGLLNIMNIPFVGPDVLSSALCMDKDICKRLLRDSGLHVAPFITLHSSDRHIIQFEDVKNQFGMPVFVKPSSEGSSVGVSKVTNEDEFSAAVSLAFQYGNKVIIEQTITGREIECAVSGNEHPRASVCGEVILNADFYGYDTKYLQSDGARTEIPAVLPTELSDRIRSVSLQAYQTLNCCGMARVDVFLTKEGDIIINEINTLPGFTNVSMYPSLQEASGIPYTQLITHLISLARESYQKK